MSKIVTGYDLRTDLSDLEITRTPIVSELLFEKDIFLLTADAGAGKSIFATQLACCLSSQRFFLGLEILKDKKVLYLQLEGDYEESIERMRYMERDGIIPIRETNLMWVEEKTLDVLDASSVNQFFYRIKETEFIPEVVIIDPIYKLCHQDISTGIAALGVIRFSDKLIHTWGCANVLIHHNLKDSYSQDGTKTMRDDAYYGHSFIKNHIRTSYAMKITGVNTRELIRKKGRGSDTRAKLSLEYNPENYCLSLSEATAHYKRGKNEERFFGWLEDCHKKQKSTDANEIITEAEVTYNQLRRLKALPRTLELFEIKKTSEKNREVWLPKLG